MSKPPPLHGNVSVILVRTFSAGNVGSVARVMKNFGFQALKLVGFGGSQNPECRMMAGKAFHLVESAGHFATLREAAAGEQVLFATTSGRERSEGPPVMTPRAAARTIREYASGNRVGLVFGPERSGLTQAQLARCQFRVSVPCHPAHPVLNLSKAAAILLYEIGQHTSPPERERPVRVSVGDRELLYQDLETVLIRIGFLSQSNPEHILNAIRGILDQPDLGKRDLRILRGMVKHLDWYVREGRLRPPQDILKP